MSEKTPEDKSNRQLIGKILGSGVSALSALSVIHPCFGVAGTAIRFIQQGLDDENIRTLQREFSSVNETLDQLSQQHHKTLLRIKKGTLDGQYATAEQNLRHHFRMYLDMMQGDPDLHEQKRNAFKERYSIDQGPKHLERLYEGVTGKSKVFSKPILGFYLEYSKGTDCARCTMEELCKRLNYLFTIGLIALMGYAAINGYDEEDLREEWAEKMREVQEKMQEALKMCK
ncbi:protein rapunzel-like [Myripristis murdjan]|nr:protein rapunzel-like [Myripristis murdjan]